MKKTLFILLFLMTTNFIFSQDADFRKKFSFDIALGASMPINSTKEFSSDKVLTPAKTGGFLDFNFQYNFLPSLGAKATLGATIIIPNYDEVEAQVAAPDVLFQTDNPLIFSYQMLGLAYNIKAGKFQSTLYAQAGYAQLQENRYSFQLNGTEFLSADVPKMGAFAFSVGTDVAFNVGEKMRLGIRASYFSTNLENEETDDWFETENKIDIINAGLLFGWRF